jgi:hypothetical protein
MLAGVVPEPSLRLKKTDLRFAVVTVKELIVSVPVKLLE